MKRTFSEINDAIGDIESILNDLIFKLRHLSDEVEDLIEDEREAAVEEYINSQEG